MSGPALALGLFDVVVMTEDAFAFVTGPEAVTEFTGVHVTREDLGSAGIHARQSGVATLVRVTRRRATRWSTSSPYLPDHHLVDPPRAETDDPPGSTLRRRGGGTDPPTASYDVLEVIRDVIDEHVFARTAAAVRAQPGDRARPPRRPSVGIVANQPQQRAGTLDIEASRKAAVSSRGATPSTSRSSRSSTRPVSSLVATSSGAA